jgi:hypothetical protein
MSTFLWISLFLFYFLFISQILFPHFILCLLFLRERHDTRVYWEMEVQLYEFLTSALDGGGWSASRPGCFTSRERNPSTIGQEAGWVPESVWTRWSREKFPAPAGTRIPVHPARSPALYHWAISALSTFQYQFLFLYLSHLTLFHQYHVFSPMFRLRFHVLHSFLLSLA